MSIFPAAAILSNFTSRVAEWACRAIAPTDRDRMRFHEQVGWRGYVDAQKSPDQNST